MGLESVPFSRPVIVPEAVAAAERVLTSGWITTGPECVAFEAEFATLVDAPYACAVSSCTAALHLALLVAGVGPGDEVVTVSHSFIATSNAVRYCGAVPIFVDIDARTFNVDPTRVEQAITERTRAILCVHQMGMPCDVLALGRSGRNQPGHGPAAPGDHDFLACGHAIEQSRQMGFRFECADNHSRVLQPVR